MTATREVPIFGRGGQVAVAIVDAADYERVACYRWHLLKNPKRTRYARTSLYGPRSTLLLHRVIMGDAQIVDHIDGNGLNCTRANMRYATKSQNGINRAGVRGVSWHKRDLCWTAYIRRDHKTIYLGEYSNYDDAVRARQQAEANMFGEFASKRTA